MRLFLLAGLLLAGCGGGGDPTPPPPAAPATFTAIYAALFPQQTKAQCSFCHSLPPNKISNGKLSTGQDQAAAYQALLGTRSETEGCSGMEYVVPGHPEQSLFYLKLTDTPPCGGRMPLGGGPLTDEQLAMVRSWIVDGAKND